MKVFKSNIFIVFAFLIIASPASTVSADFLRLGEVETKKYGFKYSRITEHRQSAQFSFRGTKQNLSLNVSGFDIDIAREVSVTLNGQLLGYLARTNNNRKGPSTFSLPAKLQVKGKNSLTFKQSSPGWRWGVTDLLLSAANTSAQPPAAPSLIAPGPDAIFDNGKTVEFSWKASATAKRYQFELTNAAGTSTDSLTNGFLPGKSCINDVCLLSVQLDFDTFGDMLWRVKATNKTGTSDWSTSGFVFLPPPPPAPPAPALPLAPEANALLPQDSVINFIWNSSDTAERYRLELINTDIPGELLPTAIVPAANCANETCSLNITLNVPISQNYTWQVRAETADVYSDWSVTPFEIISDIPGSFALSSPIDNIEIQENTEITFNWTPAAQASSYELEVIDGTDPSTAPSVVTIDADTCTEKFCSYIKNPGLPVSGQHRWRVRAINIIGSRASTTAPLNIIAKPVVLPPAPVVIAPLADILVTPERQVRFKWQHKPTAQAYEFYIDDASSDSPPEVITVSADTACLNDVCTYVQVVSLAPGKQHSWHVRAQYADVLSELSNTALNIVPDITTPPMAMSIIANNVSGGGFQSDVSITDDGLTVYAAADVSGIFKSSDGGRLFHNYNDGLHSNKVASLAITPDNDQILYAGTGDKGKTGGLFRSVDGGSTWNLTADGSNARFAGNHSASNDPLPDNHPRSNGDLIVVDPGNDPSTFTDDIIIAGSYSDGVRLFTRGGENEVFIAESTGFVRAVAHNVAVPDIAYAAIQFANSSKNGIYRIDYSNLSNPVVSQEYATLRPEGVTVLANGHVYAAISQEGIVKYDGQSWELKNAGLSVNNPFRIWTAVDGYTEGNRDILYVGVNNTGGNANGANYSSIWRSADGGESWSALVDASNNVSDTIYGQNHEWWYRIDAFTQAGLGRKNSIVSAIDVARGPSAAQYNDDIIYVSGRGGIWKSGNGGSSWAAAVNNLQVTANRDVEVNPGNPSQVVLANTDYVVLETRTGFEGDDMSRDKPADAESRAYDITFDTLSNEVIVGVGDRGLNNPGGGEVFIKSAAALGTSSGSGWTNTNLAAKTASNNGRVRAVVSGHHDGTGPTSQTILAVVEGEGVFRHHKGVWSRSRGINIGSSERSNFIWPDNTNSGLVYLLDLTAGLYRSNDGGQSWEDIWPSMTLRNSGFRNTGYLTADDDHPTTLYLSIQGDSGSPIGTRFKVYRMTGADTATFDAPGNDSNITDITNHSNGTLIKRNGPLAIAPDGSLWLTQQHDAKNSITAELYVMANPTLDTSFTNVTSDDYRNAVVSPIGMDISSDGYIYIAQNGGGIVKLSVP